MLICNVEVEMVGRKIVLGLVLVLGILPGLAAAKTAQVQSRWQEGQLKIDGDVLDWGTSSFSCEKAVKVDYAFANDMAYLYLLFIFNDLKYVSSIAQTGMTIWFNTDGKKKKTLGVRFRRKRIPAATVVAIMEKKSGPLPADRKKEIMSKPEHAVVQFMAVNKDGEDVTGQFFKDMPEPELQIKKTDQGRLVYEFQFPIGSLGRLGIEAGKSVMVAFDWGGFTKEMRQELMQRGGYEGGDEGNRIENLDLDPEASGGPGGGGLPSLRHGPKHYLFWCDLILAAGAK